MMPYGHKERWMEMVVIYTNHVHMWREIWTNVLNTRSGRKILNRLISYANKYTRHVRFHQHLIALPTARNTAKLPPLCSITFPSCVKSSRPLRPYLIPAALPNIAPVDIPIAKPIIAPYFTLSKQVGPRGRAPVIGMVTNYSSSLAPVLGNTQSPKKFMQFHDRRWAWSTFSELWTHVVVLTLTSEIMQVSTANNVKVYNLSAGKSLPEWISDRKKRTLLKNDVGESILNLLWPFGMNCQTGPPTQVVLQDHLCCHKWSPPDILCAPKMVPHCKIKRSPPQLADN